jgi:uncharacterized protein YciI
MYYCNRCSPPVSWQQYGYAASKSELKESCMGVPKEKILEATKGMLQKQVYVVLTTATNGIGPVMENLAEHLKFQLAIEKSGVMVAAGPNWTDDERSWDGDGMVIIRASSLDEAKSIAASDPMHKCGARSFTVRPWLMNEGVMKFSVTFSDMRMRLD